MTWADMGRHIRAITHFWEDIYIPSGLNGSSMFSQYIKHHMTTVDVSGHIRSRAPVCFLEGSAVRVVYPDHAAEAVGHQFTRLDPAPDLALGGLEVLGGASRKPWPWASVTWSSGILWKARYRKNRVNGILRYLSVSLAASC